ncbi:MAG: type I DNA topoisomerase [Acholeplasmatales bacterium]|nr:type I DNA topoisomerase [Acholeplasmatales bacterium]
MQKIIIVESPSKSHTIESYLGKDYKVLSSKGHISDLTTTGKDGLGIDIEKGFIPSYKIMPQKAKLVEELKKACKGNLVYLATDPDREGEAIAYHLAINLGLNLDDNNRIEFHEITKPAVEAALATPHKINLQMFKSQEARRLTDRIIGFKLSKLLQRKIKSPSAGRVQSVALMLIVDLEKEIKAFIPTKYYEMEANFGTFKLKLDSINGKNIDSKNRITDRKVLEDLKSRLLSFVVSDISSKKITRQSMPTYTTSTLQQDASNKLNFDATRTMRIAQVLYEGKKIDSGLTGLITYMRTDSTRLATSFVKECGDYILAKFGPKYLGTVKNKNQKNMQDAHEGIRPTSIERTPDSIKSFLTDEEYKLYKLIYNRTLASLMSNAIFNQTKVEFNNTDSTWSTTGSELVFDGYLKVYGKSDEDNNSLLPTFKVNESYNAIDISILDKETEPKKRYTEATLIKEMEDLGIGRPSTYAQTIQTLKDPKRAYVKVVKKSLIPTEQGILTTEKLQEFFSDIINVKYTANMEADLDSIASGDVDEKAELKNFYDSFEPLYNNAVKNMDAKYPIMTDEKCPICGNPIAIKFGKFGEFKSCNNYPHCNYIVKEEEEKSQDTGIICPICKTHHIFRRTAKTGKNKGNIFYSCENFRKCKTIYNDLPTNEVCPNCGSMMLKDNDGNLYCSNKCNEVKPVECACPQCKTGHLIERIASRGKNKGNKFYACSNFPKCRAIYNDLPTTETCPNCGSVMLKDSEGNLYCSNKCNATKSAPAPELDKTYNENDNVICPKCNVGHIVKRQARFGSNQGNYFYGCSNYPKCKNILSVDEYNKLKTKQE